MSRIAETREKLKELFVPQLEELLKGSAPICEILSDHFGVAMKEEELPELWKTLQTQCKVKRSRNRLAREMAEAVHSRKNADLITIASQQFTLASQQQALSGSSSGIAHDRLFLITSAQLWSIIFDRKKQHIRKTLSQALASPAARLLVYGHLDPTTCNRHLCEWVPWHLEARLRLPPLPPAYHSNCTENPQPDWLQQILSRKMNREETELLSSYQPGLLRSCYLFAARSLFAPHIHGVHVTSTPAAPALWTCQLRAPNGTTLVGLWGIRNDVSEQPVTIPKDDGDDQGPNADDDHEGETIRNEPEQVVPPGAFPTSDELYGLISRGTLEQVEQELVKRLLSAEVPKRFHGVFLLGSQTGRVRIVGTLAGIERYAVYWTKESLAEATPCGTWETISGGDDEQEAAAEETRLARAWVPGNVQLLALRTDSTLVDTMSTQLRSRLAAPVFGANYAMAGPMTSLQLQTQVEVDQLEAFPHLLVSSAEQTFLAYTRQSDANIFHDWVLFYYLLSSSK
jgi:hypothetical protein